MGGYDVFCCFCGAVAADPRWDPEGEDDEDPYDTTVLAREGITKPEDMAWMKDVRMLGFNSESRSMQKAFISGQATHWDWCYFDVQPGDDPNFFTAEQMARNSEGMVQLSAYQAETNDTISIPFHQQCYEAVFKKRLARSRPRGRYHHDSDDAEEVDIEVIFGALSSLCKDDYTTCLEIDYGEITDRQEQYWWNKKGTEAYVCNPGEIPRLQALYDDILSQAKQKQRGQTQSAAQLLGSESNRIQLNDPFSVLPAEIVLEIMLLVPTHTVNCLRTAAPSTRRIALSNYYWKVRVDIDMPWLYDMPTSLRRGGEGDVDWRSAYEKFLRASEVENEETVLGLVNRRRIWLICEVLVKTYLEKGEEEERKTLKATNNVLGMELKTTVMSRVAWPASNARSRFWHRAVKTLDEITRVTFVINAKFNKRGLLEGISVEQADSNDEYSGATVARGNSILVPSGDWLKAIMLTQGKTGEGYCDCAIVGITVLSIASPPVSIGITTGNKRLLHVSQDHWFVGFQGETSSGLVSRLALIEGRPIGMITSQFSSTLPWKDIPSETITKLLWKNAFPPSDFETPPTEVGYWAQDFSDLIPEEWMAFGTSEDELNSVTAFACDARFGGVQIRYSDRPTKSLGPRHAALRLFPIDGRGGERVVGINVGVSNVVHGVHIITNFGRHCVFGSSYTMHSYVPGPGRAFAGISCTWAYGGTDLTSMGMLTCPSSNIGEQQNQPEDWINWPKDNANRFWDPVSPPSAWIELGPMFGENPEKLKIDMGGNHRVPETANIASWLDLTKAVERVEVWQVHPQRRIENRTQFKTLILQYTDGTYGAIGPEEFDPQWSENLDETRLGSKSTSENAEPECSVEPTTATTEGGERAEYCDCRLYYKDHPAWPSPFHFFGSSWKLFGSGERIAELRIWSRVYMDGIQFVSESGEESQVWGFADGECTGVIRFGGLGEEEKGGRAEEGVTEGERKDRGERVSGAVGLKLVLDSNARPVTRPDVVILGMQALGLRVEEDVEEDNGKMEV